MDRPGKWKGPGFLLCAFSLAGTSVIAARLVSDKLGTFTITSVSLIFALIVLLPACAGRLSQSLQKMTAKKLLPVVLQAVFGIFLFRMFLLNGILRTSTVEAGILTGATPAITAAFAMVFLKERANWKKLAGILCSITGILLIQGIMRVRSGLPQVHLVGNLLVLCAAASESIFNILSRLTAIKSASGEEQIPPLVQTTIVTSVALIFCVIPALFENPFQRLAQLDLKQWLALLWYGLFVTALAFICWYAGIKRCGAFTAAAFSGAMPFASMLLAMVMLGEQAGWQQWSGGLLVIAGMALIGTGESLSGSPSFSAAQNPGMNS